LSGGVDSSSIVALLDEANHNSIQTVSVVFPGMNYDESEYARKVARKFNTEHHEIEISDKDLKINLKKIFYYMDQPTIDGVNSYFVSWATSKTGLKVALSGLGGDEVFFGYSSFTQIPKIHYLSKIFSFVPLSEEISKFASRDSIDLKAKICSMMSSNSLSKIYFHYRGLFTREQIKGLLNPDFSIPDTKFNLPAELKDYRSQISFLELTNYMSNQLLRDTDVFSMAHSIEVRVPFLDHKLVELLARIPVKYKISNNIPKRLLVKSIGNKLPYEIVYRKKRGFNFPFDSWMRNELRDFIEDKIKESRYFNEIFTNKLLEGFYNKKVHWSRIWGCVVLDQWLDNYGGKFLEYSS
jgi:asparagine synthase (glutamine-hydrolysing)